MTTARFLDCHQGLKRPNGLGLGQIWLVKGGFQLAHLVYKQATVKQLKLHELTSFERA